MTTSIEAVTQLQAERDDIAALKGLVAQLRNENASLKVACANRSEEIGRLRNAWTIEQGVADTLRAKLKRSTL